MYLAQHGPARVCLLGVVITANDDKKSVAPFNTYMFYFFSPATLFIELLQGGRERVQEECTEKLSTEKSRETQRGKNSNNEEKKHMGVKKTD